MKHNCYKNIYLGLKCPEKAKSPEVINDKNAEVGIFKKQLKWFVITFWILHSLTFSFIF